MEDKAAAHDAKAQALAARGAAAKAQELLKNMALAVRKRDFVAVAALFDAGAAVDAEVVDLTVSSEAEPPSAKEASAPAESPVPGKKRKSRRVRFETKKKKKRDGDIVYDFKFNTANLPIRWTLAIDMDEVGYHHYRKREKNDSPHYHFAYNAARFFHMRRCADNKGACCTDQDAYRLLKQSKLPVAAQREIDVGFWYYGYRPKLILK